MIKFSPPPFRGIRVEGWGALIVVLILPAFFLACNTDREPFVAAEGGTVIDEMKLAFVLPGGWWQNGPPIRSTSDGELVDTPPEDGEMVDKTDTGSSKGGTENLDSVMYLYMYHNLPASQDSLSAIPEKDVVFHMLTLSVDTYYNNDQLDAWTQGRCGTSVDTYCDEGTPPASLEVIRVLEPNETPFSDGTGVLYNVPGADIPVVAYIYYIVRDGWAYRISYELTTNQLGGAPYPPLLDSIEFFE